MGSFLTALLKRSLLGSALGGMVLLLQRGLGGRMGSRIRYAAWLLVLLRFLLPLPAVVALPALPLLPEAAAGGAAELISVKPPENGNAAVPILPGNAVQVPSSAPGQAGFWFFLWAAAALGKAVWELGAYLRFRRILQPTLRKPGAREGDMLSRLRSGRRPVLHVSAAAPVPMLVGLLRPEIILPARDWEPEELCHILRHELCHYRRGDLVWKRLALAVGCLHWFNPLLPLFRRELDRACELSCDAHLLEDLDRTGRQRYGELLISLAAQKPLSRRGHALPFSAEKRELKERLMQIMRYNKQKKLPFAAAVLTLLLSAGLLCGFAVSPTGAGFRKSLPEKPPLAAPQTAAITPAPSAPASSADPEPEAVPEEEIWIWPAESAVITAPFGENPRPLGLTVFHSGVDIGAEKGSPVRAARAGVVAAADFDPNYGYYCVLAHPDGTTTHYRHLAELPVISLRQEVEAGDTLGYVGATGYATGPHLHFEVQDAGGTSVDPMQFFPDVEYTDAAPAFSFPGNAGA